MTKIPNMLVMVLPALEVIGDFQLHRNNVHTPYQDIKNSQCSDPNLCLEAYILLYPSCHSGVWHANLFSNPALDHVLIWLSVLLRQYPEVGRLSYTLLIHLKFCTSYKTLLRYYLFCETFSGPSGKLSEMTVWFKFIAC